VAVETTLDDLKLAYLKSIGNGLAYMNSVDYMNRTDLDQISFPQKIKPIYEPPSKVAGGELFPHLLFYFAKDAGYEFEKEFRLVALDRNFEKERKNPNKAITLNWRNVDNFIRKIKLGPNSPQWLKDVVEDLLKKYGVKTLVEFSSFKEEPIL